MSAPFDREARFRSVSWIEDLRRLTELLEKDIEHAVEAARLQGVPWVEVGRALGVTKQAARQRFSTPRSSRERNETER